MTPAFLNAVLPAHASLLDSFLRAHAVAARTFEDASKHILKATRQSLEHAVDTHREALSVPTIAASAALIGKTVQDQVQTSWDSARELTEIGAVFMRDMLATVTASDIASKSDSSHKKAA